MVVKMMRWPWPPLVSKKFDVTLVVKRLEGLDLSAGAELEKLTVEIRWKGPKMALGSFRRRVTRNSTKEVQFTVVDGGPSSSDEESGNGVAAEWNEEFQNVCALSPYKENAFHPWEISFSVFNDINQVPKKKLAPLGTALLNLAEFASRAEEKDFELSLPLVPSTDFQASLSISLSLLELRTAPETMDPITSQSAETVSNGKEEVSAIKAGLRKVKIFKDYVSTRKAKKPCREEEGISEGRSSTRSDEGEYYKYPFDSDSLDDFEEGESDEVKDDQDPSVRKSFSYGSLAYANGLGGSSYYNVGRNDVDEDWVYYSNRESDIGSSSQQISGDTDPSVVEPPLPQLQSSRRIMLPWRKRKMSFRSPKAKGEPLLKKTYGEEGGDDIDFDRRQLSSDEALALELRKGEEDSSANRSSVSDFGDDNFAVGSWERKEVVSRDGNMKLQAEIFFASIDQRSERAAGASACTALVAVIADWFQSNCGTMPIKSQFDSLIRDGSLEWRNLCENETYRERFPDKHFDLETVLQAKIRPLSVVPEKSFVGFFHPEEGMDEARFDFLNGAMSFDSIWDEISSVGCPSNGEPHLYIVSWNDHFFILKIEPEAYYIIDTLGERLFEGCNQAYILKFDRSAIIRKMKTSSEHQPVADAKDSEPSVPDGAIVTVSEEGEALCQGKDSCKEYIKNFLAAIPIRELQTDMKKGLMASTPVHQRLQIEFHYTRCLLPLPETLKLELTTESNQ
ncbi:hypothetical protein LINPERHAP2_LOCUS13978 [Linum perenne]